MKYSIYLLLLVASISSIGCFGPTQAEEDEDTILDYILKNKLSPTKHASGIYYIIKTEGSGNNPIVSNTVTVHYKGFFLDGSQFDGSTTAPIVFPLSNLIVGWQIGIPLIKKGGEIKLIIPSALAYGPKGQGPIPPNSVLVFDINLVEFK